VERSFVLTDDPELASAVAPEERDWASRHCVASVLRVSRGPWSPGEVAGSAGGIGLLVLDGLLVRRAGVGGRHAAELVGEGDLIHPGSWEDELSLTSTTGWRALSATRLAVLDARCAARLARYPTLTGALVDRALRRSRRMSVMMAIVHHPTIEARLHMTLWHLADRFGRVRSDGVLVPLRLSHTMLADLVAAQRPSVTAALGKLGEHGRLNTLPEGWLLLGEPPSELLELEELGSARGAAGAGALPQPV
jgi:CRP/FNR family cyclic AMP-dependent transcriptional regulator